MSDLNIAFINIRVTDIEFKLNKNFKSVEKEIKVSLDFKIKNSFSKEESVLITTVTAYVFKGQKNAPFYLKTSIEAIFKGELKALKEFSKVHAPAHIFPYIRELISNLTIRAGVPPLILPPINLHKLIEKKKVFTKNVDKVNL